MAVVCPNSLKPGKYLRYLLKLQGGDAAWQDLWAHRITATRQHPQQRWNMLEMECCEVAAGELCFSREELAQCQRRYGLKDGALDHLLLQRQQERHGRPEPCGLEEQQPERGRRIRHP